MAKYSVVEKLSLIRFPVKLCRSTTLGDEQIARNERRAYPSVRGHRRGGLFLAGAALVLGLNSDSGQHSVRPFAVPSFVAWVDFDVEPGRRLFATFATHFAAASTRSRSHATLRFVGVDVADPQVLSAAMRRLIAQKPALIVATSSDVAETLRSLGAPMPTYFIVQTDPVVDGLVPSLDHPVTMTGYTFFLPLDAKIMELAHRVFPDRQHVGIVADAFWLQDLTRSSDFVDECRALGLITHLFPVGSVADIERLDTDPGMQAVQWWYVPYSPAAFDFGPQMAAALQKTRQPTWYARTKFLRLGGWFAVQAIDDDAMDVWARTIINVVGGVPAGSMPIMRPKEIEITANASVIAGLDALTRSRVADEVTRLEAN